jgi:hypothetical protein
VLAASLARFALAAAGASAQTRDLTVEAMRSEKRVALVIGKPGMRSAG